MNVNGDPQIDAAVVRIMKSKKRMNHGDLVTCVMDELQRYFKPDIADIKRRIERLIDDDYIERNNRYPLSNHMLSSCKFQHGISDVLTWQMPKIKIFFLLLGYDTFCTMVISIEVNVAGL